jgi:hypothetical protein
LTTPVVCEPSFTEGATIVTNAANKPYWEKSFTAPATIAPDEQSKAHKKPSIQAVSDKYVITDGKQTIEVYTTMGDQHTDELMVAYILPAKILVEADSYSPGPPNAPPPSPVPLTPGNRPADSFLSTRPLIAPPGRRDI